jgi:aspartate-semialdehyde dehydrogenase
VEALMASERSAGKKYRDAVSWYLLDEMPEYAGDMEVYNINPDVIEEAGLDVVFSAIPSDIARRTEAEFAEKVPVFSNTSTYRMESDVPLIVPEINPDHLGLLKFQKRERKWDGFLVTNPNCSTIGLVMPLKPLLDKLGIEWVNVATMQAVSGAGYAGVPSMAILGNIIPFISGEEPKVESEPLKIMGEFTGTGVKDACFDVFASCNRVMVRDGHTEAVFVKTQEDFDVEEVKAAMREFKGEPQKLGLPTAPKQPIMVLDDDYRPQPVMDRNLGGGMSASVGRIRKKKEKLLKFTCLSHNTIRGAAGASILNAELAYKKGLLK